MSFRQNVHGKAPANEVQTSETCAEWKRETSFSPHLYGKNRLN